MGSVLFQEIDFDLRAPYIPMDGSSDLIFDNDWVPTVDEDMFYRFVLCMICLINTGVLFYNKIKGFLRVWFGEKCQ